MLQILILLCSTQLSPAACQADTATSVISGPQVASVMACGLQGQVMLAQTAALGRAPGEYIKVTCAHVRPLRS